MKNTVAWLSILYLLQGCVVYQLPPDSQRQAEAESRPTRQFSDQHNPPLEENNRRTQQRPRKQRQRQRFVDWSYVNAGTIEISGDVDFSFTSQEVEVDGTETSDTDTLKLQTDALYYVAPNVGLGFMFFAQNEDVSSGGASVDVKTFAIGPQAGVNFPISDVTNFRLLGALFLADVDISTSSGETAKADGFGVGLTAGISHFLAENISINGGLSIIRMSLDAKSSDVDVDLDAVRLGAGLSMYFR